MKLIITEKMALDSLAAAVTAKGPGYLYQPPVCSNFRPVCLYVHSDNNGKFTPGCMVGWALHHLGVPLEVMHSVANAATIDVLSMALRAYGYEITPGAVLVYGAAQIVQDAALGTSLSPEHLANVTWGAAFKTARTVATPAAVPIEESLTVINDAVDKLIAYVHEHDQNLTLV